MRQAGPSDSDDSEGSSSRSACSTSHSDGIRRSVSSIAAGTCCPWHVCWGRVWVRACELRRASTPSFRPYRRLKPWVCTECVGGRRHFREGADNAGHAVATSPVSIGLVRHSANQLPPVKPDHQPSRSAIRKNYTYRNIPGYYIPEIILENWE